MPVAVVTDSQSCLPDEWKRELGITVLPYILEMDGHLLRDGVDIDADEFYRRLPLLKKVQNSLIDLGMAFAIEILRAQKGRHADDGLAVDEQTAQYGLLGFDVLRRQALDRHAFYPSRPCRSRPSTKSRKTSRFRSSS